MTKSKSDDWPHWCGEYKSARDFRAKKRKQIRDVLKAIDDFRTGCAFLPTKDAFERMVSAANEVKENISIKRWKR